LDDKPDEALCMSFEQRIAANEKKGADQTVEGALSEIFSDFRASKGRPLQLAQAFVPANRDEEVLRRMLDQRRRDDYDRKDPYDRQLYQRRTPNEQHDYDRLNRDQQYERDHETPNQRWEREHQR
jgi:hypothetical protein